MSASKIIGLIAVGLAAIRVVAQPTISNDDLWDVSRGVVITGSSPMAVCHADLSNGLFDARDIFGGNFFSCPSEAPSVADAIFSDGMPDGFVHYVEWATPSPVTIRSFNLWANGDDEPSHGNQREMASFRLLAKSTNSSTFDLAQPIQKSIATTTRKAFINRI